MNPIRFENDDMCKIKTLLILIVSLINTFTMIDEIRKTLNEEEGIYHI